MFQVFFIFLVLAADISLDHISFQISFLLSLHFLSHICSFVSKNLSANVRKILSFVSKKLAEENDDLWSRPKNDCVKSENVIDSSKEQKSLLKTCTESKHDKF